MTVFNIVVYCEFRNCFYYGGEYFEISDQKLLIDAASSSRVIREKQSNELIQKITKLAGYRSFKLTIYIFTGDCIKDGNEKLYLVIDILGKDIDDKQQMSFQYFDYARNKKKIYRHNGQVNVVSPYSLAWNGDCYHVLAYN